MKTFLSVGCILLFAFTINCFPQDNDQLNWGIIFSVKKDFTLGKYYVSSLPQQTVTANTTMKPLTSTGLAFEKLYNHSSFTLGFDLSLDENKQAYTGGGSHDETFSELGVRFAYNYYPIGRETSSKVDFLWSIWGSFAGYTNTITDTPTPGNETKDEYCGSAFGFGFSAGFWWNFIESNKLSLGAQYNLGGMYYPHSTYTTTDPSGSTSTEGPSYLHFGDCGARLMLRASF